MKKTEQLHMGEIDHCKGDGCHMASLFGGPSKTLEHLGFMEFEGGTQECKREDDFSLRRRAGPWIIVVARSKLLGGVENRKLTGKLVSSTRV